MTVTRCYNILITGRGVGDSRKPRAIGTGAPTHTEIMARGFTYAIYTRDDRATQYAKQVAFDQANDPARGWSTADPTGMPTWPLRAVPRRVYGVSPTTGRRNNTIVAHVDADLWTGLASTFVCETDDPAAPTDTYTVTRRRGESFPSPYSAAPLP